MVSPGLSKPVLSLHKTEISEGEVVTASCEAPGETGSMFFKFYKDSKEIKETRAETNEAVVELPVNTVGYHKIHCAYTVLVTSSSFDSNNSDTVTLTVTGTTISRLFFYFTI